MTAKGETTGQEHKSMRCTDRSLHEAIACFMTLAPSLMSINKSLTMFNSFSSLIAVGVVLVVVVVAVLVFILVLVLVLARVYRNDADGVRRRQKYFKSSTVTTTWSIY